MIGQAPATTSILPNGWLRKIITGVIIVVILIIVASQIKGCVETETKKEAQDAAKAAEAAARANTAVEIKLACGGDKEYRQLPDVRKIVLTLFPTGENCSTAWLRRPKEATKFFTDPDGDIKMQLAVGDGEILPWLDDGPLINRPGGPVINNKPERRLLNAVRYKNLGGGPVKIPITIGYERGIMFMPNIN